MIKYALPGLWNHIDLTYRTLEFIKAYPEALRENVSIGAVYDNFPYCIWDGGRIFNENYYASFEDIVEIKDKLNTENIPIRLIFTNPMLKEEHLYDRFCNTVCKICENELNEVVVNNEMLEKYLRETYPKFNYISSTTKCNIFDNSLNEIESNKYKYICLDYNQNHNKSALEKLSQEQKDKVEFLCNAICPPGCPNRKEHYRLNGLYYLNYMKTYQINCKIKGGTLDPATMKYNNNISPEEIENYYVPQGFSMFKLEGRTLNHLENVCNWARYLFKPEYQLFYINEIA